MPRTGFDVQILAPLHVLHQTQSAGFLILPCCGAAGAVFKRSNCLIPFPAAGKRLAF